MLICIDFLLFDLTTTRAAFKML